jgi:type VI secretion system secreted protein Hcp
MPVKYYLQIDEIKGNSIDSGHQDEIRLESFQFAESAAVSASLTGGSSSSSRIAMQDFAFVMNSSCATPKLFEACASGKHFQRAILKCESPSGEAVRWTLENVIVSSFVTKSSTETDQISLDEAAFSFTKIRVEYAQAAREGAPGGTTIGGWDVAKNSRWV